jgi:phosphomannomutase
MHDMRMQLACFRAYDIRGEVGVTLDPAIARRIGASFARVLRPVSVAVGRDCRASSLALQEGLIDGLLSEGAAVIDIGQAGTEEVYYATAHLGAGGGIEVTASHNPMSDNGFKLVGPGSRPLDDAEFQAIRRAAEAGGGATGVRGQRHRMNPRAAYARKIADFVSAPAIRGLKIVANAGNGVAGPAFDAILAELAARGAAPEVIRIHHEADGTFPNGIPNPLLPEKRAATAKAVVAHGADLGIAWDGDFDRCFLFDHTGTFVDGEYVVALLAGSVLASEPGARIVHDTRVTGSTLAAIAAGGGVAVPARAGHAFVKAAMRAADAAYGGEMSAHHYFRDFMSCDSGMIPWLKIAERICTSGRPLADLVAGMRRAHPSSGERNFTVSDPRAAMARIEAALAPAAHSVDRLDGISLDFGDWRMNLRASSTEPLLRLNVETRGDPALLAERVAALAALIGAAEAAGPDAAGAA